MLRPPAGTALLFGGDVTHAGLPVTAGERAVFVASFSSVREEQVAPTPPTAPDGEALSLERHMLEQMYM